MTKECALEGIERWDPRRVQVYCECGWAAIAPTTRRARAMWEDHCIARAVSRRVKAR